MRRRVPDISLANKLIGFRPELNLDAILKSVIEYYTVPGGDGAVVCQ
jgi:nucleoside-diphosphate-sugar epimerase